MKRMIIIGIVCCTLLSACGTIKDNDLSEEIVEENTPIDESLSEETVEENNLVDKSTADSYIGDWACNYSEDNVITFHINKGGIGYYEKTISPDSTWDFTYEIKDDVIVITRNALGTTFLASYELSDDGMSLIYISGDLPEGTYTKQ